jgi:hypothetical protein
MTMTIPQLPKSR